MSTSPIVPLRRVPSGSFGVDQGPSGDVNNANGSSTASAEAGPSRLHASAPSSTQDANTGNNGSTLNRPRIAKACAPCGKQKLRCDGAAPCARCISLECTDTCVYLPSLRGKTRKKRADREREAAERAAAAAAVRTEAEAGAFNHPAFNRRSSYTRDDADQEGGDEPSATIPDAASEWNVDPQRRFWDRGHQLAESGARNSALWRDKDDAQAHAQIDPQLLVHGGGGGVYGHDDRDHPDLDKRGRGRTYSAGNGAGRDRRNVPERMSSRGTDVSPTDPSAKRRKSSSNPKTQGETVDKLTTTLPLPGDAHNPLAVLVELSEVTPPLYVGDGEGDRDGDGHSAIGAGHAHGSGGHASIGGEGANPGGRSAAMRARASGDALPGATSGVDGMGTGIGKGMGGVQAKEEEGYYAPLMRTLKDEAPHIMSLINTHEAKQLFDIYFTHLHPHLPFLDKQHSGPGVIARRNNFLFNAICCAAARSYNVALWERLKDFARFEMERLPKEKNIDVVQGHLIYTCWNLIRPKRFEQDMTWLRAGIASRTAIDIALHRVGLLSAARQGLPAWLLKSIVRTWLLCFVVDRTLCIQLGKPSGRQWELEASKYAQLLRGARIGEQSKAEDDRDADDGVGVDDLLVASLTDWALILTAAVDAFRSQSLLGSHEAYDSRGASSNLADIYIAQLSRWRSGSTAELDRVAGPSSPQERAKEGKTGQAAQLVVYECYGRLVVQSLALQYAMDSQPLQLASTFAQYQITAIQLVDTISSTNAALGHRALRGVPDFVHSALTYAATSLLRCTQTRFASLSPDRARIFDVARQAADLLGEAAIGADHIAAVQSGFVSRLIATRDIAATPASARLGAAKSLSSARNMHPPSSLPAPGATGMGTVASSSAAPLVGVSPDNMFNRPPEAIDFEAFARALNVDQSMTPWPPLPSSVGVAGLAMGAGSGTVGNGGGNSMPSGVSDHVGTGTGFGQQNMLDGSHCGISNDGWSNNAWQGGMPNSASGGSMFDFNLGPSNTGMPNGAAQYPQWAGSGGTSDAFNASGNGGSGNIPVGLESWVQQQGLNLSSSGLGPGVGDFLGMGVGDDDSMGFVNEAFWQTVFGGRSS